MQNARNSFCNPSYKPGIPDGMQNVERETHEFTDQKVFSQPEPETVAEDLTMVGDTSNNQMLVDTNI